MKHKFVYLLSALLIAGALHGYAQTTEKGKWRWSIGAEAGLPTGILKSTATLNWVVHYVLNMV
jgi:hypothetical protein